MVVLSKIHQGGPVPPHGLEEWAHHKPGGPAFPSQHLYFRPVHNDRAVRRLVSPQVNEAMIYAALFVLPLVVGIALYAVIRAAVRAPGRRLRSRFVAAGQLKGKTSTEIIAAVGPPTSRSSLAGGKTVCQWLAAGYHIALVFNGDVCEGVTHEASV